MTKGDTKIGIVAGAGPYAGLDLAQKILHKEGVFLSKVFMGSIFIEIHKKANKCFKKVIKYKPLSSRKESKEIYIFCKGILKI